MGSGKIMDAGQRDQQCRFNIEIISALKHVGSSAIIYFKATPSTPAIWSESQQIIYSIPHLHVKMGRQISS